MADRHDETGTRPALTAASPLAVIALFIGLSEATVGAAAVGTGGASQLILAIFAVAFPTVVFSTFVWLLLVHPAHLYPPDQYTTVTTIEGYVRALRRGDVASQAVLQSAITDAVSTAIAIDDEEDARPDQTSLMASVADAVDMAFKRGSVTIVRSPTLGGGRPVRFPVSELTTVQELLDSIYFALEVNVGSGTYGRKWWLVDEEGVGIPNIGTRWAREHTGIASDGRGLLSVGISPGSTLTAVRLPSPN